MKKIALWSMLFCLCATSGYAQRADVAKSTKEQKQEAKAVQGDILFKTAVEAIKARNFVWEFYNPRSTDKSKVCYNFMTIEGDSIYFQAAWSTQGRMQEGFRQRRRQDRTADDDPRQERQHESLHEGRYDRCAEFVAYDMDADQLVQTFQGKQCRTLDGGLGRLHRPALAGQCHSAQRVDAAQYSAGIYQIKRVNGST